MNDAFIVVKKCNFKINIEEKVKRQINEFVSTNFIQG